MSKAPDIVWIFLDQCRADVLGCYGHPFIQTPNIDRLARRGVLFENAFCQSPVCVPSRVSMLTGLYPHQNGVWTNSHAMRPAQSHLLHAFRDAGYTSGNVGKVHLGISPETAGWQIHDPIKHGGLPHCRIPEGYPSDLPWGQFQVEGYPQPLIYATEVCTLEETYSAVGVDNAIGILREHAREPLLLRLSLDRPHTPVAVPPPLDRIYADRTGLPEVPESDLAGQPGPVRHQRTDRLWDQFTDEEVRMVRHYYYGLVTHVDTELGRLLDEVEQRPEAEDTIVVFTVDHGCMLGEHGLFVKGPHYYTETSRVPFLISWPGHLPQGRAVTGMVEMVDLLPTLCELAGVETPPEAEGRSLVPLMGGRGEDREAVFAEQWYPPCDVHWRAVRTPRWSYTRYDETGEAALYDLENDPRELENLAGRPESAGVVKDLEGRIEEWLARTGGE